MPTQGQPLTGYGVGTSKKVSDLIDANVSVAWTGTNGKVTGNIKNVTEAWSDFSNDVSEQTGHYFPFELDKRYEGHAVTVIGAKKKTAQDRKWVVRLDELYKDSKKITVQVGGSTIFTLDFTGATLEGGD